MNVTFFYLKKILFINKKKGKFKKKLIFSFPKIMHPTGNRGTKMFRQKVLAFNVV